VEFPPIAICPNQKKSDVRTSKIPGNISFNAEVPPPSREEPSKASGKEKESVT
jgi:hypothetical protein